jgi:hypothetical protein
MSAETEPEGRPLLVYDGECPLCIGFSRLYVTLGFVAASRRVPLLELEPELIERLLALGFGNEMAVVEPDRITIRTGVDGILHLMRGTWARPVAAVLGLPGLRQLCQLVYDFVGANRRFLSLPRPRGPACACEPDEKPAYNLALVVIAGSLAFLAASSFAGVAGDQPAQWRWSVLVLPGLLLLWFLLPGNLRLRALGHIAMALLMSGVVIGVGGLFFGDGPGWGLVSLLAVALSGSQLTRRFRYLQVDRPSLFGWLIALGGTGLLVATQ